MKIHEERRQVQVPLTVDLAVREAVGRPRGVVLLLHGYMQTGRGMLERLTSVIPPDHRVLAPNGPFLVPKTGEGGFEASYSWYFYDMRTDEYVVDMSPALSMLEGLLSLEQGQEQGQGQGAAAPLTIVGFSQGGYLAPFAALRLGARRVVGVGSRYLDEELPGELPFEAWSIHGDQDDRVPVEPAERSFAKIRARSRGGEFIRLPGAGHRLGREAREALAPILASGF